MFMNYYGYHTSIEYSYRHLYDWNNTNAVTNISKKQEFMISLIAF